MKQALDHESRLRRDDHQALRLWLRLLACVSLVERRVRRNLRTHFSTTLPRFDFLAQLERHPGGLKMGEISERMMVTGGNVTGIADELVAAGLVVREPSPNDRRAFTIRLTPAGRRAFAVMARAHERWIVEMFSGLTARERSALFDALGNLKAGIAPENGADGA